MKRKIRTLLALVLLSVLLASCGKPAEDEFSAALTAAAGAARTTSPVVPAVPGILPSQTAAPPVKPTAGVCLGEAALNGLNMRRTPGGDIIGCCLALGERVEISEVDDAGEWALIKGVDQPLHRGWVALRYLEVVGECGWVREE